MIHIGADNKFNALRTTAIGLSLSASFAAHAANPPGIGISGGLTWEQVRFYGPAGGVSSTYTGGQPVYMGTVGTNYCGSGDVCGEPMNFSTQIGGALTVTATDDGNPQKPKSPTPRTESSCRA